MTLTGSTAQVGSEPGAALPVGSAVISGGGFSDYLPVTVTIRDGRTVRGYRINEDVFTIQIRDDTGGLISLRKKDGRIEKPTATSVMPKLAEHLTSAELDDLVSFLSSQTATR